MPHHRHKNSAALIACGSVLASAAGHTQSRFIEDIQVSRTGTTAEIVVELACPMRYLTDSPGDAGILVEVRVAPFETCRQLGLGSGIASEAYRPQGAQLANLTEVEYESLGLGDNFLFFRFDKAVAYRVSQRADLRQVVVVIDLGVLVSEPSSAGTVSDYPGPPAPDDRREARSDPGPTTVRTIPPPSTPDYIVNLQSTREPVARATIDALAELAADRVYVSETALDGETWYRLRVGFFASEADAHAALAALRAEFPRAWVGRADATEVRSASSPEFASGGVVVEAPTAASLATVAATPLGAGEPSLGQERIAELMQQGRDALVDRQLDTAASLFAQLLAEPGEHQREAREYLGVARERLGQIDRAIAEYRAYLSDYPDDPASPRVQQRLEGLLTAADTPRQALRRQQSDTEPSWDLVTGFSQYYRRDVDSFDETAEDFVGLSALQSDIDFSARRTGGRLDMLTRISASHFYDLIGKEDNGPGDQSRIAYAYFDTVDTQRDWSLRIGRQSLYNWGVLGRFDGAHVSYGLRPDQRLHFSMGYPVDSTRDGVETERRFYGFAADFAKLLGNADLSVFYNEQKIEGIDARRAIGTELHYAAANGNVTGIVDYDIDFGEINSILALGAWRLPTGTTLNGLVDIRLSPILSTRNALIGQPVTTIEELLIVWTQEEIRQLAADRTARSTTVTLGAAQALGERFQLNADVTVTEIEGTVASGGVAAVPGTGQQTYFTTSLVGTGLFGEGDVNMWNLRFGQGDTFETSYFTWDARFPIGRRVRLNPRLRLAVREGLLDGTTRETASIALRLLFNTREHYRFEFEVGMDQSRRSDSANVSEMSGYYLDLGYRARY